MSDDLVERLRDEHTRILDLWEDRRQAAARIEAQEAEIAGRDTFIKELSDALLSIRPLGGSELFVKRFGKHYADPAYCEAAIEERTKQYHEAMKTAVRNDKRANQAESALARIAAIENKEYGGDYDEIDEAREIARHFTERN